MKYTKETYEIRNIIENWEKSAEFYALALEEWNKVTIKKTKAGQPFKSLQKNFDNAQVTYDSYSSHHYLEVSFWTHKGGYQYQSDKIEISYRDGYGYVTMEFTDIEKVIEQHKQYLKGKHEEYTNALNNIDRIITFANTVHDILNSLEKHPYYYVALDIIHKMY